MVGFQVLFAMARRVLTVVALGAALTGCASLGGGKNGGVYHGHGAESVDPKALASFAPPPLAPEMVRRVRKILEVTAPGLGLLSPDGKVMYFTWTVSGVAQIWKLDGPMRFPVQMTSGADPTTVQEATLDGKYLIVSRDHAGEEAPGLYLLPTAGGPLVEIQHKKSVRTLFVWATLDGQTIYYLANDLQPDSYALYSYDVPSGKKELLFSEPGLWFVSDVFNDKRFILGKRTGALTAEFYLWESDSRKLTPIIGQGEKEDYEVRFARNQGEYLVATNKGEEFRRLYILRAGRLQPITPRKSMDVESFTTDPRHMAVYISWNDGGRSTLEIRDGASLEPIAFKNMPRADQVYVGKASRFGRYVTVGFENSLAPRTSYVYDWKINGFTQWLRPSIPEVDTSTFVEPKLESYPARDGTSIPMWVMRPKDCEKRSCPVVVHFHGGPEGQSRPDFNKLGQIFVASGFVFVEPNVRGSEGYGKSWLDADNGPKRLNVVTDVEDCANFIRSRWAVGGVAPKIGVLGWSYGGYSTLLAMTKFAGSYDAGVSGVGMSNLRTFLLNTAPYRRLLRITEYGDPDKDREALEKLSPINYVDQVKSPLMIVQGASDPRVPVGEALQIHERLARRGIEAPLIIFADEGHGTQKRDNKVLEIGHALEFFMKNLR